MEFGSLAEWASAVASIIGAALAAVAFITSKNADKNAQAAREQAQQFTQNSHQREEERDRRAIAASLHAWWATETDPNDQHQRNWGIYISNEGPDAQVLLDVTIEALNNGTRHNICVKILPQGNFYYQIPSNSQCPFPYPVHPNLLYTPITSSNKHSVEKISFTDKLATNWEWTGKNGLQRRGTN